MAENYDNSILRMTHVGRATANEVAGKVMELLPIRKLCLPVTGFPEGEGKHVICCNLGLKDVWDRFSKFQVGMAAYTWYSGNALSSFLLLARIARLLWGINFYGVQEMNYKGLTEFKDKRLSSYTSQLKYVLNPNEFVFFGENVYSMTEGEVVKVYNGAQDMISRDYHNAGVRTNDEELYGNHIVIRYNYVDYFYGCLMRFSTSRWKVGDKVKPGDLLGKVGCSGRLARRPYLHIHSRLSTLHANIPLISWLFDQESVEVPLPMLKFENFYNFPIINPTRNTAHMIDEMKNSEIKYTYNGGSLLFPGMMIRKI